MNSHFSDEELEKAQARNRELTAHLESLQRKFEADAHRDAYYSQLIEDNERLEREIARLEQRSHDDDGPY